MPQEVDLTNEYSANRPYITVDVTVNGTTNIVNALIDTGASFTCIDETLVPMGTAIDSQAPVVGVNDGGTDISNLLKNRYRADVQISALNVIFKNVLVTSIKDNDKVILGMNIIKYLKIQHDNGTWTLRI